MTTYTTKRQGTCKVQLVLPTTMPTLSWVGTTSIVIAWTGVSG